MTYCVLLWFWLLVPIHRRCVVWGSCCVIARRRAVLHVGSDDLYFKDFKSLGERCELYASNTCCNLVWESISLVDYLMFNSVVL